MYNENFFEADISFDDDIEGSEFTQLFCSYESEDELKKTDPSDDNIFHYGLSREKAKSIIGKPGDETGEGDFTILKVL